jgi:GTP pyrophosphokinase
MIESPDADAMAFLDDVKGFFFLDEISVFTPQGELRTLPANSSVLDFAYAIHSELGDTCIGAKVDKKLAPINHILKNGQQVEIITSQKQRPKEEWLAYVVTTRAKTSIKMAVRGEKKAFAKVGKEKLAQWFEQYKLRFSKNNIRRFLAATNFSGLIDLYYAVYLGTIGLKDVKLFSSSDVNSGSMNLLDRTGGYEPGGTPAPASGRFSPDMSRKGSPSANKSSADYRVATCCNPIPGDAVIGLLASNDPIMQIHRTNCIKAQEHMTVFGEKMVKVNWENQGSLTYIAEIKVSGIDRQGLSNEITRIISNDLNLNIKSFHIDANNGLTEGAIAFYVKNTKDLTEVLENLTMVDGITHVTRIN